MLRYALAGLAVTVALGGFVVMAVALDQVDEPSASKPRAAQPVVPVSPAPAPPEPLSGSEAELLQRWARVAVRDRGLNLFRQDPAKVFELGAARYQQCREREELCDRWRKEIRAYLRDKEASR